MEIFMSIQLIVQFKVKGNCLSDFSTIMRNVKSELPKVEGCISVDIHHSTDNVANYLIVEKWTSEALHKKHVEVLVSSGVWDNIVSHLSEDPIAGYYSVI